MEPLSNSFARLQNTVYLDTAGAALYPEELIDAYAKDLKENVFGNPHSHNASSQASADAVAAVRLRVLRHFNVDASLYDVVFTKGATEAIKLVVESFCFTPCPTEAPPAMGHSLLLPTTAATATATPNHSTAPTTPNMLQHLRDCSVFAYLQDNHTSVVAAREMLFQKHVPVFCVTEAQLQPTTTTTNLDAASTEQEDAPSPCLFAYPAQVRCAGKGGCVTSRVRFC